VLGALLVNGNGGRLGAGVETHAASGAALARVIGGVVSLGVETVDLEEHVLGTGYDAEAATFAVLRGYDCDGFFENLAHGASVKTGFPWRRRSGPAGSIQEKAT